MMIRWSERDRGYCTDDGIIVFKAYHFVDHLLDEKVGMDEPPPCLCDRVGCHECHARWLSKFKNPLDGTRLWRNS